MSFLNRLIARCVAAFEAFREAPPQHYLVVERVNPLGWYVLHVFEDYDAAQATRSERYANNRHVRVLTESSWRQRTLTEMRSPAPWLALARLNREIVAAQSDLANLRAIQRVTFLNDFSEAKHP